MSPVVALPADREDVWLVIPASWRRCREPDGTFTASLSCPKCGRVCSLSGHSIDKAGKVTPSVICGYEDCDFHDHLVLKDWRP